jgi:hypothetical protein
MMYSPAPETCTVVGSYSVPTVTTPFPSDIVNNTDVAEASTRAEKVASVPCSRTHMLHSGVHSVVLRCFNSNEEMH